MKLRIIMCGALLWLPLAGCGSSGGGSDTGGTDLGGQDAVTDPGGADVIDQDLGTPDVPGQDITTPDIPGNDVAGDTGQDTTTPAITGTVTDPTGAGVEGASVVFVVAADVETTGSVQPLEDLAAKADTKGYSVATTAADGTWSLTGVADGDYFPVVLPAAGDSVHLPGAIREAVSVNGGVASAAVDIEITQAPSPSATYIGSDECLKCHNKTSLTHTLHFVGLRAPGVVNNLQDLSDYAVSDGGLAQFTDPGTCITFPAKGNTHYALLSSDAEGYYLQMADDADCTTLSAKYKMAFTYGGEGLYKQRYMFLVGPAGAPGTKHVAADGGDSYYYPAPFQWNESGPDPAAFGENGEFSGKWIPPVNDGDNAFAPDGANTGLAPEESFAADCGGCHGGTGLTVNGNGDFIPSFIDAIAPDIYAGNIGCEKCHGPGSEHKAAGGNGVAVVVPPDLTPGRAIMICGTCHQRGHGHSILDEEGNHAGFASTGDLTKDAEITVFKPGMSAAAFHGQADGNNIQPAFGTAAGYWEAINYTTDKHSWQDKTKGYGSLFDHSKGHHQQYMDVVRTTMFRNDRELLVCASCHDPHGSAQEHQLQLNADDNALCLDCHNGDEVAKGGFDAITEDMVAALIGSGTTDPAIGTAVEGHMSSKASMSASYDPTGTGIGRCIKCHMPKTAKTARWHDMANGYREGDIHSHTFDVMTEEVVNAMFTGEGDDPLKVTPSGYTNNCGGCHSLP
ncbi:MAG: hypothetical protein GXP54_09670 [Deltaproteobacteria bacterium]|nr:hypothetical protein [Deltaproteobacteria bacterium]